MSVAGGGGVAGRKGPLMPQPVIAIAIDATTNSAAMRGGPAQTTAGNSRNIERNPSMWIR
jgi:hypothetical protein